MQEPVYGGPNFIPDFVREAEEMMARGESLLPEQEEITIKFGKGLVGEPFISKNGNELVEIKIPNADRSDPLPWESFVISPKMIHENQFGKGVWMKLPKDDNIRLSRSVQTGTSEDGKRIWGRETREVTNTELKALMESYKEKSRGSVLSDLSERKAETTVDTPSGKTPKKKEAAR